MLEVRLPIENSNSIINIQNNRISNLELIIKNKDIVYNNDIAILNKKIKSIKIKSYIMGGVLLIICFL